MPRAHHTRPYTRCLTTTGTAPQPALTPCKGGQECGFLREVEYFADCRAHRACLPPLSHPGLIMDVGRRSRADGQPRSTFEDLPDPRHLLVEPAVPAGGEQGERLDRQVDLAAGSALVLDPGGRPIDEQHRAILDLS